MRHTRTTLALLFTSLLSAWSGAKAMLDWIGRVGAFQDATDTNGATYKALNWLFATPWWVPGMIAAITGIGLLWMLRPRDEGKIAKIALQNIEVGRGGSGGSGTITGNYGTVIGGKGGSAGAHGIGGDGGDGFGTGDHIFIQGGDGGNAGGADGRGGRMTDVHPRMASLPMELWGAGRGGSGANAPEYERRINLLIAIRAEYMTALPDTRPYILAGVDHMNPDWINARLAFMGESWRVQLGRDGYVLPPL